MGHRKGWVAYKDKAHDLIRREARNIGVKREEIVCSVVLPKLEGEACVHIDKVNG